MADTHALRESATMDAFLRYTADRIRKKANSVSLSLPASEHGERDVVMEIQVPVTYASPTMARIALQSESDRLVDLCFDVLQLAVEVRKMVRLSSATVRLERSEGAAELCAKMICVLPKPKKNLDPSVVGVGGKHRVKGGGSSYQVVKLEEGL